MANFFNTCDRSSGVAPYQFDARSYGTVTGDGVTTDLAPLKAAVAAAYAYAVSSATYYAEIILDPTLRYNVDGALTQGGSTKGNALIPLPVHPTTSPKVTLVLRGVKDASPLWHWEQASAQKTGATLITTATGTNHATYGPASVIGGPTPQQGYGQTDSLFSNLLVVLDGVNIVVPNNSTMCGIDLVGVGEVNVISAGVLVNATPGTVTAPTHDWVFGLRMPQNNNNAKCSIGQFSTEGLYTGVWVDEHTVAQEIRAIYCVAGIEVASGTGMGHGARINYACLESCQVGIGALGASGSASGGLITVDMLDWESGAGGFAAYAVVNDPSNRLTGRINVCTSSGSNLTAGTDGYKVNGASNLEVCDLGRPAGATVAPAVPASTVEFQNPFYRNAVAYVVGGTVTQIAVDNGGGLGVTGMTSGPILVPRGKTIKLTYSVAPTWIWTAA